MQRHTWSRVNLTILAAAALVGTAARAESPCEADVQRFCKPDSPLQILSCLQAHQPELAPACLNRIQTALVDIDGMQFDCEADAYGFCRDAAPGEGMLTCLSKRQGSLTPRCQSTFDGLARREAANAPACAADGARLCPRAKPGKGDVHICLLFKPDLSATCRKAMTR